MSPARQPALPAKPDGDVWVRTFAVRFTQGYSAAAHNHVWHQLSYASQGVMRVSTADSAWIVPPHRAVWIPAGVDHHEEMRGPGTMRSLYLASGICRALPKQCAVVNVPPLLRELILAAAVAGALDARKPAQKHLAQVIVDQLSLLSPAAAQQLPMPRDARALAVATRLQKNPAWLVQQARRLSKRYESYWYSMEKGEWTRHDGWPASSDQWKKLKGWVVRKKMKPSAATRPAFPRDAQKILAELFPLYRFLSMP